MSLHHKRKANTHSRPVPKAAKPTSQASSPEFVCFNCIGEEYVSAYIQRAGTMQTCTFCGQRHLSVSIQQLADLVNDALTWNFSKADEEPVLDRDSDRVYYELRGEPVRFELGDTLLADEPLVNALITQLSKVSEPAFYYDDDELHIEPIELSGIGYKGIWTEFSENIKHRRRFFDQQAIHILKQILVGVDEFISSQGNRALRTINPGERDAIFFRARQVNTKANCLSFYLAPQKELGPPPPNLATPGRMNPAGISVFYGSFDPHTCICEIRSPVGGIAAVASFRPLRPIRVLDLTVFDEEPEHVSYFDRGRIDILSHRIFLAEFHQQMRKPVLPKDEAIDYIPTQAVADFLANLFSPQLDGLIYSSALTTPPGRNIVLFPHASRIEVPSDNRGRKEPNPQFRGTFIDGIYLVEELPEISQIPTAIDSRSTDLPPVIDFTSPVESPEPVPSLAYVDGSLEFIRVTAIAVTTDQIRVVQAPARRDSR